MENLLHSLVTKIRDTALTIEEFRLSVDKIAAILAIESAQFVQFDTTSVQTPFEIVEGISLTGSIILVPILRAGAALLPAFLSYYANAKVGFIGLRRDEKTAIAKNYYINLPTIAPHDTIIILDPMLATGGSAIAAATIVLENGATEENLHFVGVISAPDGEKSLSDAFPKLTMFIAQKDTSLNAQKFIVPGLGDFADRYFGT